MTMLQIFIGLLITFGMVLRPFLYKKCVEFYPADLSSTFTSLWLLVALFITAPVLGHLYWDYAWEITCSPYLALSILKGILLCKMIKMQQIINKQSTSSSVFFGFIAIALGSLTINIFFNEGLALTKLICICALGILGILFVLIGDARNLPYKSKIYFILIILIVSSFTVIDHVAIPNVGWYSHLLFSSLAMFLMCFKAGITKQDYLNIFRNKYIICAGIVYSASEFLIIYASINILPVSIVGIFLRLSAPIVMILSAYKYHEKSIKNQAIFGIIALVLTLPIILL